MAELSLTVIFLLLTFTLSHARIPSDQPAEHVINPETQSSLPQSHVTSPISLPNDDHRVHSTNGDSNTVTFTTLPLTSVRFRPVPRDFLTLRTRISRVGIPCRHGHRRPFPRIFRSLEHRLMIPYGGDMIVPTAGNNIDRMNINSGVRQIPSRWLRIDHRRYHPFRHHYDAAEEKTLELEKINHIGGVRQIPARSFRLDHHHHHDAAEEKALKHEKKGEQGGVFKFFRKFLNQFDF